MKRLLGPLAAGVMLLATAAGAAGPAGNDLARRFGAREAIINVSLAPDGSHVALVVPGPAAATIVYVADADGRNARPVANADGRPLHITHCGWTSASRLACREEGVAPIDNVLAPFTRMVSFNLDGSGITWLGRSDTNATRISQFDGQVIDWLDGKDGSVLMMRDYVPHGDGVMGHAASATSSGLGVDRVDTRNNRGTTVELPIANGAAFLSDGRGAVRVVATHDIAMGSQDTLTGSTTYQYRTAAGGSWRPFSHIGSDGAGLRPVAVDGLADQAYALRDLDGRDALYRVKLDGSLSSELVYANPVVDVADVVRIGRQGRVIGAMYVTDRRQVDYFDPVYAKLAAALGKALPGLPLIQFLDASADEKRLLVFAGSDTDPGHYFIFDRDTHHLAQLHLARPELEGVALSPVKSVTYPVGDGTMVPAYLTLPPGSDGKHLPAIVLPHGGPASRDEWGFDWLAQFFAQRGFAVLQPQFRGSAGYGDAWYQQNGFKSWKTAIGDISDGARWLEAQGVADPDKLAIVGWSYGGYAALQAEATDSSLWKAVVAIAPVTSLSMLKREAQDFTNASVVARYVGNGPHLVEGSPLRHPDAFQAPVLMFHGDTDINVGLAETQAMDRALRAAGKLSRLVVYKGLDHQLDDATARSDLLAQADLFLRTNLHLAP